MFFNLWKDRHKISQNVLFPHLWVQLPDPDDKENYKRLWNEVTGEMVHVLQIATDFVKETNRFKEVEIL